MIRNVKGGWVAGLAAAYCTSAALGQGLKPHTTVTGSVQTGFAQTFQLTLGGMFGEGPAWQTRGTLNVNHIFRKNDAITAYGWTTFDGPAHRLDWQAGIGYLTRLLDRKSHLLLGTIGYQRWVFPSVATGTKDHLAAANLTWQTRVKVPVTVTADAWQLLASSFRLGTLLYVQGWTTHTLWNNDHGRIVIRPAVATTYSAHFYDRGGHRVFRYGGSAAWESRTCAVEGGVRQQVALLPGIPENRFWSFTVTRTF